MIKKIIKRLKKKAIIKMNKKVKKSLKQCYNTKNKLNLIKEK